MSKPVLGLANIPEFNKRTSSSSCINAWRGRIQGDKADAQTSRSFGPSYLVLILFGRSVTVVTGLSICGGVHSMGKTLPTGPRTKSDLEWRRPQKMNKKDFFGYHPRGCKSRVEDPCGHDGRGLHWGPRFAASPPTRFIFCCSNWFMYGTRRLARFSLYTSVACGFLYWIAKVDFWDRILLPSTSETN